MRKDMAKVIVTRPRIVDSVRRRGRARSDDLLPKGVGLRRDAMEHGGFKALNENLAPLRRYLERQVGRSWNKVFGEIASIGCGPSIGWFGRLRPRGECSFPITLQSPVLRPSSCRRC